MTLNIPTQRDPIARLALLALVGVVCYTLVVSATAPQQASAHAKLDPIIIVATPALPTPDPALMLAITAPTADPLALPAPTQPPEANIAAAVATPDWDAIAAEQQAQAWAQAQADADAAAAAQAAADAAAAQLAIQTANDPAQNGGSVAPEGCPFPIINGRCANGALSKDIPNDQFGSKSIAESDAADPVHQSKGAP